MTDLIKIENVTDYHKDKNNNAIINTNKKILEEYKAKKTMENKITSMDNDINSIKTDISQIKELLTLLSNKI